MTLESETGYEPVAELIALTGIGRRTAVNLIKAGEVPGRKIGGQHFVARSYLRQLERESLAHDEDGQNRTA